MNYVLDIITGELVAKQHKTTPVATHRLFACTTFPEVIKLDIEKKRWLIEEGFVGNTRFPPDIKIISIPDHLIEEVVVYQTLKKLKAIRPLE